jgi:ribosomal protein S18 acetylase RimI-like enzyme
MSALLRPAVVADAASIARVHIESWQSAYRGQLPDRYLDELNEELPRRTEFWRTHISTPPEKVEIWVTGNALSVEGFVAFGPARHAEKTPVAEIYAIYVHPRFWNEGVGRSLFVHAMSRLTSLGWSEAVLWVLESNARARRFYEIAGWIVDGSSKTETLPGKIELQEVCYRKTLQQLKEE